MRRYGVLVGAAAAIGVLVWLLAPAGRETREVVVPAGVAAPGTAGGEPARVAGTPPAGATPGAARPSLPATPAEPAVPEGLSAEQWRELRQSLAEHPEREAEIARIVAYLQFSARWQRYVQLRTGGAPAAELQALARPLDAGLDAHLLRRELGGGEALVMKTALLETLEPDAAARAAALQAWRTRIEAAQRGAAAAAAAARARDDAQGREFQRRQAELVAAWRALPPSARDAARLEADLDALRRSVFTLANEGDRR
jgi:hypothetical protein